MHDTIAILDFGSQYTQLIARRVREHGVYSEILPHTVAANKLAEGAVRGIILTGGPASCYEAGAPDIDPAVFDLGVPVLGICYGMQLMARNLGAQVQQSHEHEYGHTALHSNTTDPLLVGVAHETHVWMSHGDRVLDPGPDFESLAATPTCAFAAFRHKHKPLYGVQFHPEVSHTPEGHVVLGNFLQRICGLANTWTMHSFIDEAVASIRAQVGPTGKVVCGLSGGVDSAVVAMLLHRAIGKRSVCVFVDNGLLRLDEPDTIARTFADQLELNFTAVDAADQFLDALSGISDPEAKRKCIGHVFIDVFAEHARQINGAQFLAQGTLYPDVVESISPHGGPTAKIKSHHNVGGLPEDLQFDLIEPLRRLFKDEVRKLGTELGLPKHITGRHPFPGPGLAVRCLGEITKERLDVLRLADAIVNDELQRAELYDQVWQSFAVLLPVSTVGVMGDRRTYENVAVIRCVNSADGMTADWSRLPYELLAQMSNRIVNEVKGINRVAYDITSKPPGTIEWE